MFEIVTLCEVSTPAVNAAVVPPADSVPVDVMVAVPVNPVTVLLFASRAVILMLNGVPAICVPMAPPPAASTRKLFSTPGFTVNALLVPLDPFVAVSVKLPMFEIVTLCEVSTPAVNAAVVPPADSVPVDVMVAVPVNPVTVLLFASRAVILMLNGVPAICVPMAPPPAASTRKLFSTPGFTVNALLVPLDPFVAVSVKLPMFEIVTLCEVSTPAVNAAVVPPADSVPVDVMVAVPVNPVTVLLFASRAVILMLNGVPAICVPMAPPPAASTRKLFSTPGFTVNALLVPLDPFVAVSVKLPVFEIVTLCEVSTPAVNAAVVPPADSVPVDVMVAVPVNPVTVLLFTSRAVILMLNAVPAACVPMAPPPAASTRKLFNTPGFTVIRGLVFSVFVPSVISVAVRVLVPAVFSVTLHVCVPEPSAAFAGMVALVSVEVIPTVCVELMRFQFASTAFTVTKNAVPAVWAFGVPVLPLPVPGAAVSPGTKSCSFTNVPGTVIEGLVFAVMAGVVISLAVTVQFPAVFSVTLKALVPATRAAFPGRPAPPSLEVIPTVSVELTTFQFASTAFTVTVNATPAVRAVGVPVFPLTVPGAAVSPGTSSCSFVNT